MSHAEISSIQQLWTSAKEQLIQLRKRCNETEHLNQNLKLSLKTEQNKLQEEKIKYEMERQEMETSHQLAINQLRAINNNLQNKVDQLQVQVQECNVKVEECNVKTQIRDQEFESLQQSMATMQLESIDKKMDNVQEFDLKARLTNSLNRLEDQQTLLFESRAKHSEVLAKIAEFQNKVILLQSNTNKLNFEKDAALKRVEKAEERAIAAEKEAEKVIQWARGTETKASHACLILNKRMEEIQDEAATIVGLQSQAQKSLVEMREAMSLSAKREGQYRAKVASLNNEIAYLHHQKKMLDFQRLAAEQEMKGVSASALNAASKFSTPSKNSRILVKNTYDPTWLDSSDRREITRSLIDQHKQNNIITNVPSMVTHEDFTYPENDERSRPPTNDDDDSWMKDTTKFINSTKQLLRDGENQFGLSPVKTSKSGKPGKPSWYPKTVSSSMQ
jgi:hypothetical protein